MSRIALFAVILTLLSACAIVQDHVPPGQIKKQMAPGQIKKH